MGQGLRWERSRDKGRNRDGTPVEAGDRAATEVTTATGDADRGRSGDKDTDNGQRCSRGRVLRRGRLREEYLRQKFIIMNLINSASRKPRPSGPVCRRRPPGSHAQFV